MSVAENIKAREVANTLMDLGITLAKEEGLEPEQVRRMWQHVIEYAGQLVGVEVEEPTPAKVSVAAQYSTRGHELDDEIMEFGKRYKGERFADVPEDYWQWIAENVEDLERRWPLLWEYIEENGLG